MTTGKRADPTNTATHEVTSDLEAELSARNPPRKIQSMRAAIGKYRASKFLIIFIQRA
jgi:hypothetical protein